MRIQLRTVVIDCRDAQRAAAFYGALLGWEPTIVEPDWVLMRDPVGGTGLSFQAEEDYSPPVWPEAPGEQQKMLHLDFLVDDLDAAVRRAIDCGARKAPDQFFEGVTVLFDPDGHPFCLFVDH